MNEKTNVRGIDIDNKGSEIDFNLKLLDKKLEKIENLLFKSKIKNK